jgi:acyl transferase domain-containing protein
MSCKFAGNASSPSKLWDLIAAGKDGWSPIPKDRFDAASLYHPDQQRTDRVGSFTCSNNCMFAYLMKN